MENASKALIMAAEVLIGVMIISIGVYLFNVFGQYSADNTKRIEDTQISEFNNQFLKFYGSRTNDEGKVEPIKCTIHDIVSLANLAKENNKNYGLENESGKKANTFYIQIYIKNKDYNLNRKNIINNLEKYDDLESLIKLNSLKIEKKENGEVKTKTKYYECTQCDINPNTKRDLHKDVKNIIMKEIEDEKKVFCNNANFICNYINFNICSLQLQK